MARANQLEATVEEKGKPIHMFLEPDLLEKIEDYRFKHRFNTRVETIKALLRLGLDGDKRRASAKT